MPKHWGLQYQKRVEDFTKIFISQRSHASGLEYAALRAAKDLKEANIACAEASTELGQTRKTLEILMDIGPEGLKRLEGEQGDAFTPGQIRSAYLGSNEKGRHEIENKQINSQK